MCRLFLAIFSIATLIGPTAYAGEVIDAAAGAERLGAQEVRAVSTFEPVVLESADLLPRVRGKKGLWTGLGMMAVAVPAGAATSAIMGVGCPFECMGATFAGAGVGGALLIGGALTATVGGTQAAITGAKRRRAKKKARVAVTPSSVLVVGRF